MTTVAQPGFTVDAGFPGSAVRMRRADLAEDRAYLAKSLPIVTTSGYYESAAGFLEAVDDGVVTPVVFLGQSGYRGLALVSIFRAGRNERSLYIAALYGEPDATDEEREAAMQKIEGMARLNGCSRLTFNTTRKGWARRAARYGFKPSPYVAYERSVGDGR